MTRIFRLFLIQLSVLGLAAGAWLGFGAVGAQGQLVVTTTADNGDDVNPTAGSLRAALLRLTNGATISFNIPKTDPGFAGNVFTIKPPMPLPTFEASGVTIDGATQTAAGGDTNPKGPEVFISGELGLGSGLLLTSANNTIRGLGIVNCRVQDGGAGIAFDGETAKGNRVVGCFVGVAGDGTTSAPNVRGIVFNESNENQIGGPAAADRNVISGNLEFGIAVGGSQTRNNVIQNNLVGPSADGESVVTGLGKQGIAGISVEGLENTVVGNVISGNGSSQGGDGLLLTGDKNIVRGNRIGTNAAGTKALSNGLDGISLGGAENLIGGNIAGEGNLVSGNGRNGISVNSGPGATGNVILGNIVGADAGGKNKLANDGFGIVFVDGSHDNRVGGTASGEANLIAFNTRSGVGVISNLAGTPTYRNAIIGNSIFQNGELGIDLGANGVTPNDLGDEDTGANELMNFASIQTLDVVSGNSVKITGQANFGSRIDIYAADPDPSGFGEGKTHIATIDIGKDTVYSATVTLPAGTRALTATATDDKGNTSEFSKNFVTSSEPPPPDDTEAPKVTVISPNGKEKVKSSQAFNIIWGATDNVGITSQSVLLSTDGGNTFPVVIADGVAGNVTSFLWTGTKPSAKAARIRVTARDSAGNTGQDSSDANFKIK